MCTFAPRLEFVGAELSVYERAPPRGKIPFITINKQCTQL